MFDSNKHSCRVALQKRLGKSSAKKSASCLPGGVVAAKETRNGRRRVGSGPGSGGPPGGLAQKVGGDLADSEQLAFDLAEQSVRGMNSECALHLPGSSKCIGLEEPMPCMEGGLDSLQPGTGMMGHSFLASLEQEESGAGYAQPMYLGHRRRPAALVDQQGIRAMQGNKLQVPQVRCFWCNWCWGFGFSPAGASQLVISKYF